MYCSSTLWDCDALNFKLFNLSHLLPQDHTAGLEPSSLPLQAPTQSLLLLGLLPSPYSFSSSCNISNQPYGASILEGSFFCALFTDFASHVSVNFLKDLGSARMSSSSSSFYLFLSLSCQLVSLIAMSAQDLSMWHFLVGFSALRSVPLCRLGRVPQAASLGVS